MSLEFCRKPYSLEADDFLGACYRKAMTLKKLWTLLFLQLRSPLQKLCWQSREGETIANSEWELRTQIAWFKPNIHFRSEKITQSNVKGVREGLLRVKFTFGGQFSLLRSLAWEEKSCLQNTHFHKHRGSCFGPGPFFHSCSLKVELWGWFCKSNLQKRYDLRSAIWGTMSGTSQKPQPLVLSQESCCTSGRRTNGRHIAVQWVVYTWFPFFKAQKPGRHSNANGGCIAVQIGGVLQYGL